MKLKIKEIYPKLYHIEFPNQYIETASFMRIQEFYESSFPEIRGHYFTVEEYMDRYAKFKGNFTYNSDWSGFNVSGEALCKFRTMFKLIEKELLKKEEILLSSISKVVGCTDWHTGDFYVIATHKGNQSDLKHEIAHGLFYLNSAYRKEVVALIRKNKDNFKPLKQTLKNMGYGNNVINDEIQAYLATDCEKAFNKLGDPYKEVFKQVFNKYYKEIN